MQRPTLGRSAILTALLFLAAAIPVAPGQGAKEDEVKKARLSALYRAYQAYEIANGKPAKVIEDLALAKDDEREFKRWLKLDELGLSLAEGKKEDLKKIVIVYEKEAPKEGGLVMFYDGSVQKLSAAAAAKLVGRGGDADTQERGAKSDALAKEAVEQFFKAFKAKDLEALMKGADVPFCREGGKNLAKREDLKQFLQKALDRRDPSKDSMRIARVTTLPKLEEAEGKFTEAERKTVETVLGKDHRVVKVEWDRHGEGKHKVLFFIRLQEGEAKVVGIL